LYLEAGRVTGLVQQRHHARTMYAAATATWIAWSRGGTGIPRNTGAASAIE